MEQLLFQRNPDTTSSAGYPALGDVSTALDVTHKPRAAQLHSVAAEGMDGGDLGGLDFGTGMAAVSERPRCEHCLALMSGRIPWPTCGRLVSRRADCRMLLARGCSRRLTCEVIVVQYASWRLPLSCTESSMRGSEVHAARTVHGHKR